MVVPLCRRLGGLSREVSIRPIGVGLANEPRLLKDEMAGQPHRLQPPRSFCSDGLRPAMQQFQWSAHQPWQQ